MDEGARLKEQTGSFTLLIISLRRAYFLNARFSDCLELCGYRSPNDSRRDVEKRGKTVYPILRLKKSQKIISTYFLSRQWPTIHVSTNDAILIHSVFLLPDRSPLGADQKNLPQENTLEAFESSTTIVPRRHEERKRRDTWNCNGETREKYPHEPQTQVHPCTLDPKTAANHPLARYELKPHGLTSQATTDKSLYRRKTKKRKRKEIKREKVHKTSRVDRLWNLKEEPSSRTTGSESKTGKRRQKPRRLEG